MNLVDNDWDEDQYMNYWNRASDAYREGQEGECECEWKEMEEEANE